jgi:hypothetical protein
MTSERRELLSHEADVGVREIGRSKEAAVAHAKLEQLICVKG